MRCSPLLYLVISAIFQECYAMMPGFHGSDDKMIKEHLKQGKFLQSFPGQTCELIPNIGLPYPEYHARDSHYGTKLISLNSYVCADMKFAEPYYKTEAVHLYDKIDHHIFDPKQEPGVERSFGSQENGFILGRAKYYDLKKKPFNPYTGKYLKPSKGDGILKPPKGHSKRKSSKPKHKVTFKHSDSSEASQDDSGSNSRAKHKTPINSAKVAPRKVSDSESVEKTDRDRSISKRDDGEIVHEANKPLMLGGQVLGAASGGALAGGEKKLEKGVDGVKNSGKGVVEGAKKLGNDMMEKGKKHGKDMVKGAKKHGNDMVEKGKKHGKDMVKGAKKHGNDMVEGAKKLGNDIGKGAKKHGNDIVEGTKKHGNDMVDGAKKLGNDIGKGAKKHGNDMVEGTKKHGNNMVEGTKKLGNDMVEGAKKHGNDAKERGKGVLKDARDHGKSMVDKGTSRAKEIAKDVKSRGEDLLEKGKSAKNEEKEEGKKKRRKKRHHRSN